MASKQFPYLIFIARLCAGTLAGVGLAFYTLVLIKCLDYRFPGQGKFLTAMPVIGVSDDPLCSWEEFTDFRFRHQFLLHGTSSLY
jgi:hypothetical protein